MIQIQKQETFYKDSMPEPWKAINDICKGYFKGSYEIVMDNITDCNKYPESLKFISFDWKNLKVIVYREPDLKLYSYETYTDALNNIDGNKDKFLNEGLRIHKEEDYKRIMLFKQFEEKSKLKELNKGDKTIKQGDFLNTCWGYDQTNIEFFIIKKIIGKNYFIIQEVAKNVRNDYFTSTAVKVNLNIIKVDIPIKAFISNEGYMHICEYGYKRGLSLTDINEEHYETAGGFGH